MSENDEYPSNSNTSKLRPSVPVSPAKPSESQRPKAEKAIEGEVAIKRKSVGKRFAAIFTGVSLKDVFDDVVDQAIIPGLKGLVRDAGDRALDRWLGNGATGRIPNAAARTMVTNVAHVAYNKFSAPNAATVRPADPARNLMAMSRRGQAVHDFDEIEFQSREDASIILDLMYDRLQEYGSVSVAEFYAWADVRGNFTDQNWGWRSLEGAGPTRNPRTGMVALNLPAPIDLNR
jgi:hypothetical protein